MLINFAVTRFARCLLNNALRTNSELLKSTLHGYLRELQACDMQSETLCEAYIYYWNCCLLSHHRTKINIVHIC